MSPRLRLAHQGLDAIAECDEFVHEALISVTTNEAEHRLRPTQRIQGGPQDQLGRLHRGAVDPRARGIPPPRLEAGDEPGRIGAASVREALCQEDLCAVGHARP